MKRSPKRRLRARVNAPKPWPKRISPRLSPSFIRNARARIREWLRSSADRVSRSRCRLRRQPRAWQAKLGSRAGRDRLRDWAVRLRKDDGSESRLGADTADSRRGGLLRRVD